MKSRALASMFFVLFALSSARAEIQQMDMSIFGMD
jgi:hypothetical protein